MNPKYLIAIVLFAAFGNTNAQKAGKPEFDYKKAWKQVDSLEKKNLPASALKIIDKIYTMAKTENNGVQLIKAISYQVQNITNTQEDSHSKAISKLEQEISTAKFPVKQILYSFLASSYWNFYEENRYNFSQRTQTVSYNSADINTWSLDQIVAKTINCYQNSLLEPEKLRKTKAGTYEEIMFPGNKLGQLYRPFLYDILAHQALDFFMDNDPDITKPAVTFSLNSPDFFSESEKFSRLSVSTSDTFSYKFYALKLFQEIISFHLKDAQPDALIDVERKRLEFIHQNSTLSDNLSLYQKALEALDNKYKDSPGSTLILLDLARSWNESSETYKPLESSKHKWDKKKAYDLCSQAIKRFPESNGAKEAYNYQQELLSKELSAKTENINIPGLPFRALVYYKNFTNLYWRIIRVTPKEIASQRLKWENNYKVDQEQMFIQYFATKPAAASGKVILPADGDLQQHSTEIKLDAVPAGDYLILFSNNEDFSTKNNGMAYTVTTVSNLAYIHRNKDDGTTDFYVLNRTTGEPVPEAVAQVYVTYYDQKLRSYQLRKEAQYISDKNGYIKIPYLYKPGENYINSFQMAFSVGKDTVRTYEIDNGRFRSYGQFYQSQPVQKMEYEQVAFFLDRAIYRPGQTLYFKGLLYKTNTKTPTIVKDRELTVSFFDVNSQLVAEQKLTTNSFGTFSGTFTTPTSGLMGQMRLHASDQNGSEVYFSVEEYKRPKFEVKFEPVKGSYKFGEKVKVTGKAQAYSGANIDGAKVQYRVVRQAVFPFWYWCWFGYYPPSPETEIANGTAQTKDDGSFDIDFTAIPDETVSRESSPTFVFKVNADVTDVNGETHSSSTSVSIGYKALVLGVIVHDIEKSILDSALATFAIKTTNLAGEFEPASGNMTVWKLKTPDRAYRERLWEQPDTFVYSRSEFEKFFPLDLYKNENNFYKWEKEKVADSVNFNTSVDKNFPLNCSAWDPGKYMLQISAKDKFGEETKEVAYFDVTDQTLSSPAIPSAFQVKEIKVKAEPGETAKVQALTSEKVNYLFEIEKDGDILKTQWDKLNNQLKTISVPISEDYRGNIAIHLVTVLNNRLYTNTQIITVPFTNKELDIKFESFRDKLLPGQDEQWKIKISSKTADKIMAEMVATLYDASLDAFVPHSWYAIFYNSMYSRLGWQSTNGFKYIDLRNYENLWNVTKQKKFEIPSYGSFYWSEYGIGYGSGAGVYMMTMDENLAAPPMASARLKKAEMKFAAPVVVDSVSEIVSLDEGDIESKAKDYKADKPVNQDFGVVKTRKNFNETAFFYPHLQTDEQGQIIINFTIPEALTRWKMLGFAHTTDLKSGLIEKELVTQKDLMVVPNQPRFFREGDKMVFQSKVTSMTDKDLTGQARLEFFDALTMKPVDVELKNTANTKDFSLRAHQSANLEWSIEIPEGLQALTYRIVARSGDFSDGEEMTLPVVTNRTLVTETLPLSVRGKQTKEFTFEKLVNNPSNTLRNQRFTLEFTSNPAWYAIQALPYLMEYPFECTEQTFSRFYANSIAAHIANSNPNIKKVFDTWATIQPDALLSNLEKNQELKTALLQETPWVLNAKDESQRKRNVALLFDLNRMANEQERAIKKIEEAQLSNGGFSWFPGLPEDLCITQYIVSGLGHLDVMGVQYNSQADKVTDMLTKAIAYMDLSMKERYDILKVEAQKKNLKLEDNNLGYFDIQYLYARSYFKNIALPVASKEAFNYFISQAEKYWTKQNNYGQGMLALALKRNGKTEVPADIVKSLKERSLNSEEMGMYWKLNRGYYWYEAPIETQALMIEVFDDVAGDKQAVEDLKVWLLKQKQTQDWETTKATSEACYALLRRGTSVLASNQLVEVTIGNEKIDPAKREDIKVEAGTGYFKTAWTASEIKPEMGKIKVKKTDGGVAWGAAYWQYFEQLDKITTAETPLKISKQLFKQTNTDRGPVLTPLSDSTQLHVGDLVKVRVEIRCDRTMEYIHLKDMRASAFEPVETLSGYKYQDGLWYYQSPGDLATNFFIGFMPKGTYVFEYSLRASQVGDFSNGITTIQCMYAPEFSSHSEGVRVKVTK